MKNSSWRKPGQRPLNPPHVRARSRALAHLLPIQFDKMGHLTNASMMNRVSDHCREIAATARWFGWRVIGFSPAQIIGGQVKVSDLSQEMRFRGGTTPPW